MIEGKDHPLSLEEAAMETARSIVIKKRKKPVKTAKMLHRQLEVIREQYKKLIYSHDQITHAFEWLYDNYYILEREGRLAIKELEQIDPVNCDETGTPAVYLLARSFCNAARGSIDAAKIEEFLGGAQKQRSMESAELSGFGVMLRAALIEGAARACVMNLEDQERKILLSDAVKTLNFLTTFDFSEIIERQSGIERIMTEDPAGIYTRMDERSRGVYRDMIAKIARKRKMSETDVAAKTVEMARMGKTSRERHVGYYILERELDRPKSTRRGKIYLFLLWSVPAILGILLGLAFRKVWLPFLVYLPLWEIVRPIIEYETMKGVPATYLPRLENDGVVPEDAPTLVVISTLLSSPQKIEEFVKKLEQFYYSNGRGAILFGLLADLKESKLPEQPEDKAIKTAAIKAIRKLNERLGPHFCIFIRSRRLSRTQGKFSGWERKRGAIIELIRYMKGVSTSITTVEGDARMLHSIKYLITLDADTGLLIDTASEMVSVAMHPLNEPEIAEGENKVGRGYGILSPKISIDLESAGRTPFSRVMAGCGGVTAYDNAAGNAYQDLFGEGIYAGKGLINVDAFYSVLDHALPENRILSHDILEGCYMRVGFVSDVEMTDGFPPKPAPWFDRLHRWIRGDWQNISYISGRIKTAGGTVKIPFGNLSRFKLADNLRRSVTPVASVLGVAFSAFTGLKLSLTLILIAFLSIAGPGLWSAALAVARGGFSMLSRKYHCKVLPQAVNSVYQGILLYLFLPYHALIAADGVIRALWRQMSGRKMLEWVTAAENEARVGGAAENLRRFWVCTVTGVVFLAAAVSPLARVAGAFWIITPFVAWMSGRPMSQASAGLTDDDKEKLRSYTAAMWRYYEDYVGEKDHFLPPDNVQEAPVHVVAHRTSPTNIGLYLLSTLAARDLRLIDSEILLERVTATLSTIEKLGKWKGHLYNWYDTVTLEPLKPRYVSTVDSGNLLCCLTALSEGLKEYAYLGPASELTNRIQKLIDDVDLGVLFNKRRKLFHIGYDIEKDCLSEIYYDLLMSEARMTSYYAVARRIAPKRHWGALGRTLTRQGGYTGPISWTGTMFEYLMPHLLLPVFEDSLAAETIRFVINCQKRRVKDRGIPWGISESGFYSFDASLNYQYEAHGVQKLALKRGMDNDLVISPYSGFLALPFDPEPAMKNLEKLEDLGMYGRCGFFEAADFTYRRTEGKMEIVKSYMAHHVGMSIVASANALLGGVMQERFMKNYEMRAAQDLLQEQIPSNAVVFHDVMPREIPDKPGRSQLVREEFDSVTPVSPRVHAVSNGEYTMALTDTGASASMFRGIDITRRSSDLLKNPMGIYAVGSFGGKILSATAAPDYPPGRLIRRKVEFNSKEAVYYARTSGSEITMRACLHGHMPCEARMIEVGNLTSGRVKTRLLVYFEPVLAKAADEAAHPAFSRLFLHASYREDTKILIFARRPRSGEMPAFLAVGFAEQELDFEFDTDRERLLSRPDGIASLPEALKAEMKSGTGALPEAAAALRITTELPPHGKKNCTLLLAAANSEDEAAARLIEARRHGYSAFIRSAAGKDSNEMETRLAALILPQILFPVKDYVDKREAVANNRLSQQGLWSLGISGDYPLILFEYRGQRDAERLLPYIKTQRALRLKGIQADLVITYREGGDYSRQQHSVLNDMIKSCGSEYLIGGRGGVHLVNLSIHPEEIYYLLLTTACHTATSGVGKKLPDDHYESAALNSGNPVSNRAESEKNLAVYGGEFLGPDFIISHEQKPSAPWCHVLANRTFGTLLSDRALGFTWALNSRENKLTPWNNDPLADNRGEMLLLKVGNKIFDLCANARVTFSPSKAVYETVIDQLFCRVTVEIPGKMMAKLVRLEIENRAKKEYHLRIAYYVEPIMGVNASTRRHISIQQDQGVVQMRNAWAPVRGAGFLTALEGMDGFLYNRAGILSGNWENAGDDISPDSCAAAVVKRKLPPGKTTVATFVLGWAAEKDAAQAMAGMLKSTDPARSAGDGPLSGDGLKVSTPDPYLDALMDTWLRWQFMSSRIMGKTGFYQNGGAWGFRDQLQDCCAALLFDPQFAKAHLYRSAAHQFKEGDVMHWWHQLPPRDGGTRGVRTRCSDDMLWLPLTLCEYLEKTGDDSIFDHEIYYLDGKELEQKEEDRYFFPQRSEEKENLYFHCVRAIERAKRLGAHEIPLFGGGDWNDGMNLVGIAGKGESVWLAMFLSIVLERFAPLCKKRGDEARGEQYLAESAQLRKAVDETCWDGKWYLRGFYDDGFPLGGKESGECRIDLLPQSFSAIAGFPDKERRQAALDSALKMLKDDRLKIVRLFTPPFDGGGRNPGYICSYPPGIRENGGQYTHAAIWLALGLLKEGRGDDAFQILQYINPAYRSLDQESSRTYRLEPYAIAADIYANQSCEGRGGWSLYTGAAGWYYRTVFEDLLGIQIRADHIGLNPVMPSDWQGFSAEIRLRGSEIHLRVEKGTKKKLTVDGAESESIPLDGKKHNVLLVL